MKIKKWKNNIWKKFNESLFLKTLKLIKNNIWKKFNESLFLKTLKLIKKGKKNILFIVLFDALFLAVLYGIVTMFSYLPPLTNAFLGILLSLLYFLLLVFAYSFFKYTVLDYVISFVQKKESDYKKLKEFYILNLLISAPLLVILLLINIILVLTLKTESLPIISSIISTVVAFFLYPFINISHSLFVQGNSWKKSLFKSLNFTFKKIKHYLSVYGFGLGIFLTVYLIFNIIWVVLRLVVPQLYLASVFQAFTQIYSIISLIFLYFIIVINRLYFYIIVER